MRLKGLSGSIRKEKVTDMASNTDLHSSGDRGGSEELTQAYREYVEESDAATTKVYT